jgi:hypothetical protein
VLQQRPEAKIPVEQMLVTFEDFCKIVSEFQQTENGQGPERLKLWDNLTFKTSQILRCIAHPFSFRQRRQVCAIEIYNPSCAIEISDPAGV